MIQLDDVTLRRLQMIELEMLVEVDRICRKCGIKYNIIAGTLLGAIRHGGFIPWDDDADIGMLRSEYERFRAACETELDKTRFYFQDHRNTEGYRWGYGKLRRKDTLFLRENQEHMPYGQGVFIDIFPLDHVPENYLLRSIHNLHCFCIRKVLWSAVGRYSDKKRYKRLLYQILYRIPEDAVFAHYERLVARCNRRGGRFIRITTFPTPNKVYGLYKKWFQESRKYTFENAEFDGIKQYDAYLRFKYGDYMSLPPVGTRKAHPVSKLELLDLRDK